MLPCGAMSRLFLVLSCWVLLGVGCRHANVPVLPASHGHLSQEMHRYLDLKTQPVEFPSSNASEVVVEPAQAPALFAEAVQALKGSPTQEQAQQAWEDLNAACNADYEEACAFLGNAYERPVKEEYEAPSYPLDKTQTTFATTVMRCLLGVDGRFRNCEVLERAPFGLTEAALERFRTAKFQPAKLAGHPIAIPFVTTTTMSIGGSDQLTPEQQLRWARARTESYPKSTEAWKNLAHLLARLAPKDPGYIPALQRLNSLSPHYWWSANELAWAYVQEWRYAEAAPLAKRARAQSALNPYVLETSAGALFGTGQCEAALADQRAALAKLPEEWPAPERERLHQALRLYQAICYPSSP